MTRAQRRQSGFMLLSALILLATVAALGLTYTRHVTVDRVSSATHGSVTTARESTLSALDFTRQALQAETAMTASAIEGIAEGTLCVDKNGTQGQTGEGDLTSTSKQTNWVQVQNVDSTCDLIWVRKLDALGLGATRLVEATWQPLTTADEPDALPRLEESTRLAIDADTSIPRHYYSSNNTLEDVELTGLVVLASGVTLTLRGDVVIQGSIVSAASLGTTDLGAFDGSTAPELRLRGTLRVVPQSFLPGVALLMPDGEVTTGSGAGNVQIEGDVVAHRVQLATGGVVDGSVYAVDPLELGSGIGLVGAGRLPREPAGSLEFPGPRETASLALVPRTTALSDLDAILNYSFP